MKGHDLKVGDSVRLLEPYAGHSMHAWGQVLGFNRRATDEQIAVLFDSGQTTQVPVSLLRVLSEAEQAHDERDSRSPTQLNW
jgi:hypothetical protein